MPNVFSRLIRNVRVHSPGVSSAGIKSEIFETMVEFCFETNFWYEDITVNVVPKVQIYSLQPNSGNIVRLISLGDSQNNAVTCKMDSSANITLSFIPTTASTLSARVAKVPYISVNGYPSMPADAMTLYSGLITDGVMGRIMMQPNKPWTNLDTANIHLRRWRAGLNVVRAAVGRGNLFGANAWVFPGGWRGRTQKFGIPSFGGV